VGEVKHLKAALKQRDEQIVELNDRVRELEVSSTADKVAQEAVQQAEGKRRGGENSCSAFCAGRHCFEVLTVKMG
jgi:hypothetical protein